MTAPSSGRLAQADAVAGERLLGDHQEHSFLAVQPLCRHFYWQSLADGRRKLMRFAGEGLLRDSREDMLCEQTLMMKFHLYPP